MTGLNLGPLTFRETRQADDGEQTMAQTIVQASLAAAQRSAAGTALATIEACAGLYERAFASALSPVLQPWQLAMLGRSLLLSGESVWFVPPRRGGARRPTFEPVYSVDVKGTTAAPATWDYRLTIPAPGDSRTVQTGADRVLHVRAGCIPARPWRGVSPFATSDATRQLLANVEKQLRLEAGGPVGHIVAVPEPTEDLANDINALAGGVVLGESGDQGADPSRAPEHQWRPNRIGMNPPQAVPLMREGVERSLLAAAGVPVELVHSGQATAGREAWRRFLFGTVAPLGGLLSAELQRLGYDGALEFSELRASDVAGRARAYQSLRGAGMEHSQAARIAGVE